MSLEAQSGFEGIIGLFFFKRGRQRRIGHTCIRKTVPFQNHHIKGIQLGNMDKCLYKSEYTSLYFIKSKYSIYLS